MDDMTFIDKIRKIIKMRHDDMVQQWHLEVLTIWKNTTIC